MDARVTVKENGDFRRIYRRGRSAVSGGVVVYCLKNRKGMSRLGVTVSTKLGHAVVRNRVRRRLRELYRLHKAELLPGYDLIVVARVRAVDMPYAKLEKQYLHCLSQLELLREDGIMSLCIYYGRETGFAERDALLAYLRTIDSKQYTVMICEFANRSNCPPIPVLIWKGK